MRRNVIKRPNEFTYCAHCHNATANSLIVYQVDVVLCFSVNMDISDEFEEAAAAINIILHKERPVWVHEVNKVRETYGEFHTQGRKFRQILHVFSNVKRIVSLV